MRELKLKYFIDLVSNLGPKAQADAKAMQQAQAVMAAAITGTNNKWLDYSKLALLAGKNTAMMQEVITGATNKFAALDRAISQVGNNTSLERQLGYLQRLGAAADQAYSRTLKLRMALADGLDKAPQAVAAMTGSYYGAKAGMLPPLKAYASLEQATMDLRVAMTNSRGQVPASFAHISDEAVKLGNELPGTTKDFMHSALALKANGTPDDVIANGGLRAAAYLGVLLKMDQESAAVMVAKTREAYGLKDTELVPAADAMQKARFAYGIKPADLLAANTYASGTLNAQHWSGLGRMREVLALQGLAAQRGIDGSVFGTDLKDFMGRLAMMDHRLEKKSPEARRVRGLMQQAGIDLHVIGEDGYLVSPTEVHQQMQRFNALKPQERNAAFHTIFGEQGGQIAQLMTQTSPEKFAEMLVNQDNQGDLNTRLAMTTSTLQNRFEALTGTVENVLAKIGMQTGEGLKSPLDKGNDLIGGPVGDFFDDHPTAGTVGLLGAGGIGAWLTARFGAGAVKALLGRGAATAAAGAAGAEGAAVVAGAGMGVGAATGLGLSGMLGLLRRVPGVALASDVFGTSDGDLEVLAAADRMRQGFRGKGFDDPRRLDRAMGTAPLAANGVPQLDWLTLTAPGTGPQPLPMGKPTEIKLGEGLLNIAVHVQDDRVSAVASVGRPLSVVRINTGNTNPGGY